MGCLSRMRYQEKATLRRERERGRASEREREVSMETSGRNVLSFFTHFGGLGKGKAWPRLLQYKNKQALQTGFHNFGPVTGRANWPRMGLLSGLPPPRKARERERERARERERERERGPWGRALCCPVFSAWDASSPPSPTIHHVLHIRPIQTLISMPSVFLLSPSLSLTHPRSPPHPLTH